MPVINAGRRQSGNFVRQKDGQGVALVHGPIDCMHMVNSRAVFGEAHAEIFVF